MTQNVTLVMSAVFILFLLTILSTRVRENQGRVRRLCVPPTEAPVFRKLVLSILEVTVWTRPIEKCCHLSGFLSNLFIIFWIIIVILVFLRSNILCYLFFFFIILVIEFLNPSFDTT